MNILQFAKFAALGTALIASATGFAQSSSNNIDQPSSMVETWVDARQILSQETNDWREQKNIMSFKINLLKVEIKALEEQIEESRKDVAQADAKRLEMEAEESKLRSAALVVENAVARYEQSILRLANSFPQPLLDKISSLLAQIPTDSADSSLTVGDRTIIILGILNEVDKFNANVTVVNELREIDTGNTVEVKTLYLGLAQAYFVDSNQQHAKSGRLAEGEWVWTEQNAHAHDIWTAIAMYENVVKPATFIELPITIN